MTLANTSFLPDAKALESILALGDLSQLTPEQRAQYYIQVCDSIGLNPITRPFEYVVLNQKLTLYAKRDATDQLRRLYSISIEIVSRELKGDIYLVIARATDKNGRIDESTGAVNLAGLRGESLANAYMKAETKAKRRVTLSICGLGFLDDSEVDSVQGARRIKVDEHGVIDEAPPSSRPVSLATIHAISSPMLTLDEALSELRSCGTQAEIDDLGQRVKGAMRAWSSQEQQRLKDEASRHRALLHELQALESAPTEEIQAYNPSPVSAA